MGAKAVIIGASGLVGNQLLKFLLIDKQIDQVISLGRKELPVSSDKLRQIIVDFQNLNEIVENLHADFLFCCVGTTIKTAGSQENFRNVDYEIPKSLAQLAVKHNIGTMIVISSLGADAQSSNFYLRTKGEMEKVVQSYPIQRTVFVQPSLLLGNRNEYRFGERIATVFMQLFSFAFVGSIRKYRAITSENLAKAMIHIAFDPKLIGVILSDKLEILSKRN
ncbi:MAG: NAD(P)H-binding protein [Bacteroidales bacterium]